MTEVVADRLERRYGAAGSVVALNDVSLVFGPGEFVAVTGPSGSGKSTLLHLLGGLDRPDGGRVLIDGDDLALLSESELAAVRRRHIGFVFQSFELLGSLTAWENVAVPALLDGRRPARARSRALALLEQVGLADRADHRPGELSGGEAQRVAIARALMADPQVVLADEPTGNLDTASAAEVLDLLGAATIGEGRTLVLVTHNLDLATRADRTVRLVDGRVTADVARTLPLDR